MVFCGMWWRPKKFCNPKVDIKTSLTSLHFAQNYPRSLSKVWQWWCRASKAFYLTSLLPLCNVFCLKITGNRQHFFCIKTWAKIKWQILPFLSSNGCILIIFPNKFVAAIIRSSCVFHTSFNKASWCKNMIACKYRRFSIFPHEDIFSIPLLVLVHHYFECLLDSLNVQGKIWWLFCM